MTKHVDPSLTLPSDIQVPITGRQLTLPPGPIFHLQRQAEAQHEIGAFRPWAGYKDFGSDAATGGLALFQHVLSFGPSEVSGRTGIHCHLSQVHIVIPTSGVGAFSYDGLETDALPGSVIVQHGGTVHDQFYYSYAAASAEANRDTPLSVDATPPGTPRRSFAFLELFVPPSMANVEIVPARQVTPQDHASAWDHPYHAPGCGFALQAPDDPSAAWKPVADHPDLEMRDAQTWEATGRLVATRIFRAAQEGTAGEPASLEIPGETGGIEVLLVITGAVSVTSPEGTPLRLKTGDCLTCTAGLAGAPVDPSPDLRLLTFFISARAELLRERTPEEIRSLEAMGPAIITRREVRPAGDRRPINLLHEG